MSSDHITPAPYSQVPDYSGYRFHHDGLLLTQWLSGTNRPWVRTDQWLSVIRAVNANGYTLMSFRSDLGKTILVYAHVMFALSFFGPCPEGLEVCHGDDVAANNSIDNIYYGTRAQNLADAMRNGRRPAGERHSRARLTESQVKDILSREIRRGTQSELAKEFNVPIQLIHGIITGRTWKHVPRNPWNQVYPSLICRGRRPN